MRIIREQVKGTYPLHYGIKCFDCKKLISKSQLKNHMGHSVHYLDQNGERDD